MFSSGSTEAVRDAGYRAALTDFLPPPGGDVPPDPWARPPVAPPSPAVPYPSSAYATSYGAFAPPRFSSLSGLATGLTVLLGVAAIAALVASIGYFVLPGMQIGQAAKASDPQLGPGDLRAKGKLPAVIVAWAVLFGAAICLFVAGNSSRPADEEIVSSLDEYAMADRLVAAGMLVGAAAAVAAIMMVRTLTARQRRAVDGYQAPPPPPPPPPFQGRF